MRQAKSGPWWRMPRPFELAGSPRELPVALGCAVCLVAIFIGDVLTPVDVLLSALTIFPVLLAAWVLGRWPALVIAALAGVLFILEAATGSSNRVTVAVEVVAYGTLAGLTRLYARHASALSTADLERVATVRTDRLTRREREVVALAVHGRTASEIADLLHIGERTVETHLANAYPKLGVRSKLELVKEAARLRV